MKRVFAAFLLLVISASHSGIIRDWDTSVSLSEDGTADWAVKISFDSSVQNVYYIVSSVRNVRVTADGRPAECVTETAGVGTSIKCNVKAYNFTYAFSASDMLSKKGGFNSFNYRFNIPVATEHYSAKIELPVGSALVPQDKLQGTGLMPFEPVWDNEPNRSSSKGSDGRTIFVSWTLTNPKVGEGIDARVIYEAFDNGLQAISFAMVIVVALGLIGAAYVFRRRSYRHVLPVLTESERRTMEILLRGNKPVDQRAIIKELDYSKPKVSRLVHDLQQRGLVEVERKGRNNLIKLRKTQETGGKENEAKKG